MNKNYMVLGCLFLCFIGINGKAQAPPTLDPPVIYRMFFQHEEDGMRFTGCVNSGGMCYSPDESIVQDCLDSNGNWTPCGWE